MMRVLAVVALFLVSACAGHMKGSEVGLGFDWFDTQSQESKEKDAWFRSYYGNNAEECNSFYGECTKPDRSMNPEGFWGGAADTSSE
jgi:hypothetical protein